MSRICTAVALLVCLAVTAPAWAQDPPGQPDRPDRKSWTVNASAGLALTSGNTDTSTVNAAYELTWDPGTKNLIRSDGLMIRGKSEGELSANRIGINIRDEYRFNGRSYVFGQHQYLRDEFKGIEYLVSPSAGIGYKLAESDATKLSLDGGIGGVWEKNPDKGVRGSGALSVGQKLTQTVTANTTFTQSFSGLWQTTDLSDALYTVNVGIAAAMSARTQLKIEALDTYKAKPPAATLKQNDVAIVMAIVYKM